MPVPGFICQSDRNTTARRLAAPISYRAVTGSGPTGDDGVFAPGHVLSLAKVEAGDGLSHTAAFSERLVGDNQPHHVTPFNYEVVPGPVSSSGCAAGSDPTAWRGDAGASWTSADYRFTLYNHALPPGGHPSCVAQNGKSAFMGTSSGHVGGINLLLLDDAVVLVRRSIDQKVWKELATIGGPGRPEHRNAQARFDFRLWQCHRLLRLRPSLRTALVKDWASRALSCASVFWPRDSMKSSINSKAAG